MTKLGMQNGGEAVVNPTEDSDARSAGARQATPTEARSAHQEERCDDHIQPLLIAPDAQQHTHVNQKRKEVDTLRAEMQNRHAIRI
jgi:hypothetical protein